MSLVAMVWLEALQIQPLYQVSESNQDSPLQVSFGIP